MTCRQMDHLSFTMLHQRTPGKTLATGALLSNYPPSTRDCKDVLGTFPRLQATDYRLPLLSPRRTRGQTRRPEAADCRMSLGSQTQSSAFGNPDNSPAIHGWGTWARRRMESRLRQGEAPLRRGKARQGRKNPCGVSPDISNSPLTVRVDARG